MTQPFSVHQFHFSTAPGDAITNQMLFIRNALLESGIQGEIFSQEIRPGTDKSIRRFHLDMAWNCDLMLVHHSQGNPVLRNLLSVEIPKALIYHNITPERFFAHDPFLFDLCKKGREQLSILKNHCVASFADSKFNATELEEIGFHHPRLLPLFDLTSVKSQNAELSEVSNRNEPKNLLFVGRLAPHKNQKLLIETFFYLRPLLPKGSKLFLIGSGDKIYTRYLKLLIRQLGLSKDVLLQGKVTDRELENYYELADLFVCASEHEGFCIPLVEAMKHGLPVAYLPKAATTETMGNSGLTLLTEKPEEIAHCLYQTLEAPTILNGILLSQSERLAELHKIQSKQNVQLAILPVLESFRKHKNPSNEVTL